MTILDKIIEIKRDEIAHLAEQSITPGGVRSALAEAGGPRGFASALVSPRSGRIGLIAEIKKASPSRGVIRPDFDPVAIAREYDTAGADCLSVLTDAPFFQGSLGYLREIRKAVSLPLLRKDFILDARQVLESAEAGADAILLIVAILKQNELATMHELAVASGLDVVVEVHNADEMERALEVGARLIGINNRDLKTFTVDLATTETLAGRFAGTLREKRAILVSESGIFTRHDVERVLACGASAILVGEALMREGDISAKVRELAFPAMAG